MKILLKKKEKKSFSRSNYWIRRINRYVNWTCLHYEVIVNGKKISEIKTSIWKSLKGEARKKFEIERIKMDLRIAEKES